MITSENIHIYKDIVLSLCIWKIFWQKHLYMYQQNQIKWILNETVAKYEGCQIIS